MSAATTGTGNGTDTNANADAHDSTPASQLSSSTKLPDPDALKRLLLADDQAALMAESNRRGFQLHLFHLYRSQSDIGLRQKAAQLQRQTIESTVEQARASNDEVAKSELRTLHSTLRNFVAMDAEHCPEEIKPTLLEIFTIVNNALK